MAASTSSIAAMTNGTRTNTVSNVSSMRFRDFVGVEGATPSLHQWCGREGTGAEKRRRLHTQ